MQRITLLLLFVVPLFCACHLNTITGSGNIITEKRSTSHFEGIKLVGFADIEIRQGDVQGIEVEADDNVLPYVETKLSGGTLIVGFRNDNSYHNVHAKIYITTNTLDKVAISGSGNIISKDTLKNADKIELTISGSGDINMMVDAPSVVAHISGSGNISLQGRTRNFDATSNGSGDFKCHDLLAETVSVNMSGSGNAHVFASVSLKGSTRGSGDILYSGNPASTQVEKRGSGEVRAE